MILVFEMMCLGTGHASTNCATIQTICCAYPQQEVHVFAHPSHVQELQSDSSLSENDNILFHAVPISRHYMYRPHIVSARRGLHEAWTLSRAIWGMRLRERCLIVLLSATPTAIFAASLLAKLTSGRIGVQAGLHGNLNDAFGWRTRNPLLRAIDLRAALSKRHGGRVRLLVLEDAIRRSLIRLAPATAAITDVLPHPIRPAEVDGAEPNRLSLPMHIGMVGQATESKGITPFLTMARAFKKMLPDAVSFHLVGNAPQGTDMSIFAVLHDPAATTHISRPDFQAKLRWLHYVCLLLQPGYYELSASGALMDAVIWLRPIIATRVPIVEDLFNRFGDIGELCDDEAAVHAAIERLVQMPDPQRYDRQVANLRRLRASRLPVALAPEYRRLTDQAFGGLLQAHDAMPVGDVAHG